MEFGQDAGNNVLVIVKSAVGWGIIRNLKGSTCLALGRSCSPTTAFSGSGAFLERSPVQLLIPPVFGCLLISRGRTQLEVSQLQSQTVSEILLSRDLNKMGLSSSLVFWGRISKRLYPGEKKKKALIVVFLGHTQLSCFVCF